MRAWIVPIGRSDANPSGRQGVATSLPWVRLGDELLIVDEGTDAASHLWAGAGTGARTLDVGDLHLVTQLGNLFQMEHPEVPVVLDKGRYLIVDVAGLDVGRPEHACWSMEPVPFETVVFQDLGPLAPTRAPQDWVQDLVGRVSSESIQASLEHLVSYPTRFSAGDHYAAAASWARHELAALGYATRVEPVALKGGQSQNVVAEAFGAGPQPRRLVVVVAHLDSVNTSGGPSAPAPGADDNASGSAGLLEIARVLSGRPFHHDLRLVLFGGEEQGLHGSRQHVSAMPPTELERIAAVVNMDMIAGRNTATPTVLIEGARWAQALIDALAEAATIYTSLHVQTSLNPFNSDHVSFLDAGAPAVLTIEGADSANPRVHTADDTANQLDHGLSLEIVRMNVAAVATALDAPGAPMSEMPVPVRPPTTPERPPEVFPSTQLSSRYTYDDGRR